MENRGLAISIGVLLIIYALFNIGGAIGHSFKGDVIGGLTSLGAETSEWTGNQRDAASIRREGGGIQSGFHLFAVFIMIVAIAQFCAAVGLFGKASWSFFALLAAGIGGMVVEVQDYLEDGFGISQVLFMAINIVVVFVAFQHQRENTERQAQ